MAKLASLVTGIDSGFACGKSKLIDNGLPHLRPFNVGNDMALDLSEIYMVPVDEAPVGKSDLHAGDLLFNNTNSAELVGKVAYVESDMVAGFSNHLTRIRCKSDLIEPAFLAAHLHYLGRQGYFKKNCTQWVSQAAFNASALRALEVPLPSIPQQRCIVDILNHANSIRRLRREALEKARAMIPALFVEMFGDPATNPREWPISTVGKLLTAADYGTSQKASEKQIGVPVLRMGNVTFDGDLALGDLKYVELSQQDLEKYRLQAGDILFNRTNSKELVGKTGIWDERFEAVPASYFIRLRVDLSLVNPHYVWAFFNARFMKRRLFETARGAIGQSNINAKEVKAFPIPLPPLSLQDVFAERVTNIQAIIDQQERQLAKANEMMNALMARFFGNGAGMEVAA